MRDRSDRYQVQPSLSSTPAKRIGSYFVEAGLLTPDQVSVILNDQQATGMRFGEIVVARGWLKEQTIEWVVMKVVEPERRNTTLNPSAAYAASNPQTRQQRVRPTTVPPVPLQPAVPLKQNLSSLQVKSKNFSGQPLEQPSAQPLAQPANQTPSSPTSNDTHPTKPFVRRDVPISKPLPSVGSADSDVNWVG